MQVLACDLRHFAQVAAVRADAGAQQPPELRQVVAADRVVAEIEEVAARAAARAESHLADIGADESDPDHVGRTRRAERNARNDDNALP